MRTIAPDVPPPPVSIVLDQLLTAERAVTVGELFDRVEERGFGLLLILLGLPMLIPVLPPGASTVVGAAFAVLAVQLFIGRHRPWLPAWVRRKVLSPSAVAALRRRGLPLIRRLERISRPRVRLLRHAVMVRVAAVVVFILAMILAGPFPLTNLLPSFVIMLIGFGLLNDDGVLVFVGTALGGALIGAFGAALSYLIQLARDLLPWLVP